MRDHVPHWPFIDGTMLAKTKNATREKKGKKSSTTKARPKKNPF